MESKITTETVITLSLNEIEASWLKGVVQTPVGKHPEDEGKFEKRTRLSFCKALDKVEL
jgi:hypothetical protein